MDRVFVSYSRVNKNFAERVARDLSDAGMDVWVDFRQIHGGEMWQSEIFRGLERAEIVIACLSPTFLTSEWCAREVNFAREQKKFIIPVMVFDTLTDISQVADLGWLSDLQFINFENRYESAFPELLSALPGKRRVNAFDEVDAEKIPNPFKGLESFQQTDAAFFFGRENLVKKVLKQLQTADESRFLPVIGASGSGKSSLVRAGVIPHLRQGAIPGAERWRVAIFTPGDRPVNALAVRLSPFLENRDANALETALSDSQNSLHDLAEEILSEAASDVRMVLVIDQFEEVFTRAGEQDAEWFLQLLVHASTVEGGRLIVLATMRADFFDRLGRYPHMAELFEQEQMVIVTEMTSANLLRTIEGPAQAVGLQYEDGLAARILDDVRRQPGSLPLLQHALNLLYTRRRGRMLTHAAYDEIGGVQKALARHAETIYAGLDAAQQDVVRRVLLRLVEVSETGEATRRRIVREELRFNGISDQTVQNVVDLLTAPNVRLLIASREIAASDQQAMPVTRLEVCHEALIREWERYENWIKESEEDLRFSTEVLKAANDWVSAQRDVSYLLSGSRLFRAAEWLQNADANPLQREFIGVSIAENERKEEEARAQAERELALQRKAANRLRIIAVVLVGALVIAIGLTAFALSQSNLAAENAQLAEQRAIEAAENQKQAEENAARAEENAARAEENASQARSFALASNAERALDNDEGDLALALAVESALTVAVSPPESRLSLANVSFAPGTRRRIEESAVINAVVFTPEGDSIVSGMENGQINVWGISAEVATNAYTRAPEDTLPAARAITELMVTPDGNRVIVGTGAGELVLLNYTTRQVIRTFARGHTRSIASIAVDANGDRFLSASADSSIVVWDIETGEIIRTLRGHRTGVISVSFDQRNPNQVISIARDGAVIRWDITTGNRLAEHSINTTPVSASFSPDGRFLVVGAARGVVQLWEISATPTTAPQQQRVFAGISDESTVRSVAISPDSELIASGGSDETIVVWLRSSGERVHFFTGHNRDINDLSFSADSARLVSGSRDETVRIWDLKNAAIVRDYVGHIVSSIGVFLPNSRALLSASDDQTLRLWDTATGRIIRQYDGHTDAVLSLDVSSDGQQAISGGRDNIVRLWDLVNSTSQVLEGHTDAVNAVRFLPDDLQAISAGRDGAVILWDLSTGQESKRYLNSAIRAGPQYAIDLSDDGTRLASGGDDQVVSVYNIATGEVIQMLRGQGRAIRAVAFSPDGTQIVTGAVNGDLLLWDLATGEVIRSFIGHNRTIHSVEFGPDGSVILSASIDGTIRVWDTGSGFALRIYTLEERLVTVTSVIFDETGETILSGLSDGRLRLWRLYPTVESLLAWTFTNRYIAELTCEQRTQFRVPPLCDDQNPTIFRQLPDLLDLAPLPSTVLNLSVNSQAFVHVTGGDNLFLRSEPSTRTADTIISRMPAGTLVTLLEGPLRSDGLIWWRVRTENGNEGWAVAMLPNDLNNGAGDIQTLVPVDVFGRIRAS